MAPETKRPLKVFLCHASRDKPPVRDLYKRLTMEGVDAWLDKEKLLPGQDWQVEIPRAVHDADVVVVCLSNKSVTKEGYVQKEIRFALDIAEEKPEGTIFLIPARLEDCPVPERLNRWQWVDLYEENGFVQLLRSLKLRAGAVGAVIEAASYEDTDKDRERKLNQLYTEGLEAFYIEDWDRACRRFQSILSEQPNHKSAAEKLEEAQCQGHYAKLYSQATEAYRSENWIIAIPALEELSQKAPNYKDAAQLLRDARKREQLAELYEEAKTLHAARKWKAVVKVFEQISIIEPNYPDADGLLLSAQKEVGELERIARLNDQYSRALQEMDDGNWYEARRLLEGVHKSQTGFLETEKLLRKVENEILKDEEKRKQNDQVNILYEQAHGLLRSRKWRNALEKLEEIYQLDEHFNDPDGIVEKAQKELEREEREAERQNKLAAMYAEAVRLLKEEKYQDALDKWQDVRVLDAKYPDRQGVQRTANKNLSRHNIQAKRLTHLTSAQKMFLGAGGVLVLILIGFAGIFIYTFQPPVLPQCLIDASWPEPLMLKSSQKSAAIFVDGKVTYPAEWTTSSCYQTNLRAQVPGGVGCGDGFMDVPVKVYLANDERNLYLLFKINKSYFVPQGLSMSYFHPYPWTGKWQLSDQMAFYSQASDVYGWDEEKWYKDSDNGGTMDTHANSSFDSQSYWFEFSKPLNSGDGHDWVLKPGALIGTKISGDLLIGSWGTLPSQVDRWSCRMIKLQLAK